MKYFSEKLMAHEIFDSLFPLGYKSFFENPPAPLLTYLICAPLAGKKELGESVNEYEEKYDKELKDLEGKTNYNFKRKKYVPMKPKQGFMAAVNSKFYIDLAKVKHDDPNIDKICKEMSRKKYL